MMSGPENYANLAGAFKKMLPRDLALAVGNPAAPSLETEEFASEAAAMVRAVPKRRIEFFAGRATARRAMRELGHFPAPVPMGKDRVPVWPEGLIGSISHCKEACVALVAELASYRALAVDIEPDIDLPAELLDIVCSSSERERIAQMPKVDRGRLARLVFSAKETVYKLQYPIAGKFLEFSDVEIDLDVAEGRFEARLSEPQSFDFPGQVLVGRFGRAEGTVFCVMFEK